MPQVFGERHKKVRSAIRYNKSISQIEEDGLMLCTARIFQPGMILQRNKPAVVWGTGDAGRTVTVEIQGQRADTVVNADGTWQAVLPALTASEQETMTISDAEEKLVYSDIAIGEVWLAGGQSNMEYHMRYEKNLGEVRDNCENPRIRFYDVPEAAFEGQTECFDYSRMGIWRKAGPEEIEYFSAVGYYFQRELEKALDVPVGIVGCNWGGTVSAAWMDPETVKRNGSEWMEEYETFCGRVDRDAYMEKQRTEIQNDRGNPFADPFSEFIMPRTRTEEEIGAFFASMTMPEFDPDAMQVQNIPGSLYEHMVKKAAPFGIRGILWYQGESDDEKRRASLYRKMLTGLIGDWRKLWGEELPFLIVQLPGFERWLACENLEYDVIRDAQQQVAESVPNTWLCSISDAGERFDIHPKNKRPAGERLALLARGHVYGEDILCDAPKASGICREGDKIIISFDHAKGGLVIRGDSLNALVIRADGKRTSYSAETKGDKLIVTPGEDMAGTIQVSFAKEKFYLVNLYNQAEIPAIPFTYTIESGEESYEQKTNF